MRSSERTCASELKRIQAKSGRTLIYVTHDQIEAMTMATMSACSTRGDWCSSVRRGPSMKSPSASMPATRLGQPRINVLPADLFAGAPAGAKSIGLRPEHIVQGDGEEALVKRSSISATRLACTSLSSGNDLITVTDAHTPLKGADHSDPTVAPLYFRRGGHAFSLRRFLWLNSSTSAKTSSQRRSMRAVSFGGALTRLDGYPHIRVVKRSDWDKSRVAIVSGGGSGHEPAMSVCRARVC